jgi:3-mercaptopyruvate sulfurtransferase SseA
MKPTDHWKTQAKQLIRAEMKRRSLSYADLANRMQELGLTANERTVANKIAAGGFSAAFFLQCMEAIGVKAIHLNGD